MFEEPIANFMLSPDHSQIVAAYSDGRVQVIDLESSEVVRDFTTFSEPVSLDWHENSLAVLGYHTELEVWSIDFE